MNSNLWAVIQWSLGSMDEAQAIWDEIQKARAMPTFVAMGPPAHAIVDLVLPVIDDFPDLSARLASVMSEPEVGELEARAVAAGFDFERLKQIAEVLMVSLPALIAFLKGLRESKLRLAN